MFVKDLRTGRVRRVSAGRRGREADGHSGEFGGIAAAGRFLAYSSQASNLVVGDTNGRSDVFVAGPLRWRGR